MKLKRNKTPKTAERTSSFKLPQHHAEILEEAVAMTAHDPRELVRSCLHRTKLKSAGHNLVLATDYANEKTSGIIKAIDAIPRHPIPASKLPMSLRLEVDEFSALADASSMGKVTKTDILAASIEEEIVEVVRAILIQKYLSRDKRTTGTIGEWAAHMSRNKGASLLGGRRVMKLNGKSRPQPPRKMARVSR